MDNNGIPSYDSGERGDGGGGVGLIFTSTATHKLYLSLLNKHHWMNSCMSR